MKLAFLPGFRFRINSGPGCLLLRLAIFNKFKQQAVKAEQSLIQTCSCQGILCTCSQEQACQVARSAC